MANCKISKLGLSDVKFRLSLSVSLIPSLTGLRVNVCGVAGVRRLCGLSASPELARQIVIQLRHRGPDDLGVWTNGADVAFGHTRLAIIDLDGSAQPMSSPNGHATVVFNGEILNYRALRKELADYPFKTDGDTEVLLALYEKFGHRGVDRLEGQFAYAIHDGRTNEIHLFRDRVGILPLYYYLDADTFAFASEIKALLSLMPERAVDEDSIYDYLTHRVVPAPNTLIRGVRKVLPGHRLTLTADGRVITEPYWVLKAKPSRGLNAEGAVDLVDALITRSVRSALVADVPIGMYLSGGVDSSLLTALAAREPLDYRLQTFSASFGDHQYDESSWARRVSNILGTTHHQVNVTPNDFLGKWSQLSWYRDGPLSEPADLALHCLARLAREHVKVVLSGEGSDEIFGGYPKHRFASATRWLPGVLGQAARKLENRIPTGQHRGRIALRAFGELTYGERLRGWFAPFTAEERLRLLNHDPPRRIPEHYTNGSGDSLQRMLYADMFTWLSDNLLERGDRMAMAASLETRPPFLDHRLIETAFALPSRFKVHGLSGKWILKEVARRYLPADVVDRPKVGFKVPLDQWFRGELKDFAYDLLTARSSFVRQQFEGQEVTRLLECHLSGRRNEDIRIWTLLSLEVWHRELASRGCLS